MFSCAQVLLALATLAVIAYPRLVIAGSPTSATTPVPPGTVITQQNWQQYRPFMSEGLAALFQGDHFWHLPSDFRIEVGPTISIPLPKKYLEDTAKYSSQVKLLRTSFGGYVPMGYVAGLPFPHPLDGDRSLRGQRVFWDSYYRYQPRVQAAPTISYSLDRYGNSTQSSEVKTVLSRLEFLSDVDFPRTVSDGHGFYFVRYSQQLAPEQGKYSTLLDMIPADPTKLDELYEFVPTLRRSLRLSQAARCAPVFGSDYLVDDENDGPPGLPQLFEIDYLGEKKIMTLEHAVPMTFQNPGSAEQPSEQYYYPGSIGFVPFPKPSMGKWEIRDSYVISLSRLPIFAENYCYSRRIMYVDKENYFSSGELDLYDPQGNLFKTQLVLFHPVSIPKTRDISELVAGSNTGLLVDFIHQHVTVSPALHPCVNSDCAEYGYLDVDHYASPDGLSKIVQ
jgi:Protein of unknown function (DUF1329)